MNTGDLDGDGDLDIACDGNAQDHIYVWINAGCTAGDTSSHKTASIRAPQFGERVDYTIVIRSLSAPLTHTVVMTDAIPVGLQYVDGTLSATTGTVEDALAPTLTWTGDLSPTGTVTVSYSITVTAVVPTVITNTATIDAAPYGAITETASVLANWSSLYLPHIVKQ